MDTSDGKNIPDANFYTGISSAILKTNILFAYKYNFIVLPEINIVIEFNLLGALLSPLRKQIHSYNKPDIDTVLEVCDVHYASIPLNNPLFFYTSLHLHEMFTFGISIIHVKINVFFICFYTKFDE